MKNVALFAISLSLASPSFAASPFTLNYIGQNIVPSGTQFNGTTVGGLSGIDYNASTGRYFAISDDRSGINPARFYDIDLDLNQFNRNPTPGALGVSFSSVTNILTPGGGNFAVNSLDPEAIRLRNGQLYWTNEGQRSGAGFQNPTVREMNLDGSYVRDFQVPNYYNPSGTANGLSAGDSGIRNNLAFESLTFSNDGQTLYTATENALAQDNPLPATILNGTDNRVLALDVNTGSAIGEYIYFADPVIDLPVPITNFATNGLVELLNVPGMDGTFIAVERAFSAGAVGTNGNTGNNIRLYLTSIVGATNILGETDLDNAGPVTKMNKQLLLDLDTLTNNDGSPFAQDNIEGITWGEDFNGKPTLILVSDNNFSGTQFTQFVAFSVQPVPVPAAAWLMLSGLAGVGLRLRRRA